MKRIVVLVLAVCVFLIGGVAEDALCGHRFGGGLHYLRTVGDIKDVPEWDPDAVGILGSYQFAPPLFLAFEFDVEWLPNYGGTDESLIEPQAWVLTSGLIYGGGGIGIGYINSDWQENPFYALRLGVNVVLLSLNVDVFATYRFQSTGELEGFGTKDLDTVTLGAVVRFGN
jgi:hypothetical protein